MSEHRATVAWKRLNPDFAYESFSRDHTWAFGGGVEVPASASPDYYGNPSLVDPEKALVASLSSCHMLTFLAIASRKRLLVDEYVDEAVGVLEKNPDGKMAVTRVVLKPKVTFAGERIPSTEEIEKLHARAHDHCFIANSVRTEVTVEPQ